MTTPRPVGVPFTQDLLLICLESSVDEPHEGYRRSLGRLEEIVNTITTYTNVDDCIDFIEENKNQNIFIVISETLGFVVVPRIHHMSQIRSICLFGNHLSRYEQCASEWRKVRGVVTDMECLCEVLQQHARLYDPNSTSITITNARNSYELEPTFMYTTLFRECILQINYDEDEIEKMADGCRELCGDANKTLRIFDEFKNKYHEHSPIWWYTRGCFIYEMLNRALRAFDTRTIVMMGSFIRDLHRRIEHLHIEQRHLFGKEFIVYRGQSLSKTDFVKLSESPGGLLSFNNFLSTSKDRNTSIGFAHTALDRIGHVAVLFKMVINSSVPSSPFTIITEEGFYASREAEILFSMNSIFRIGTVKQLYGEHTLFEIDVILTSNNDEQRTTLTQAITEDISGTTGWYRLGKLLLRCGDLERAETLYQRLLQTTSEESWLEVSDLNNQLGEVYFHMGEYLKALEHYEKSLEIRQNYSPPTHPALATSYSNIGAVYLDIGEYLKALELYETSLEIRRQSLPSTHPDIATSYDNIGQVYSVMGGYSKALEYHKDSLRIKERSLPSSHPSLATTLNDIGWVYTQMGENSKALEYYKKSLEIRKKSLPPMHPDLAKSYANIGERYLDMGECHKALEFCDEAHQIYEKSLPPAHPNCARNYNYIGRVYSDMGEYSTALEYYERAHKIYEKSLPPRHLSLAAVYSRMGRLYRSMNDYSKALEVFEATLKIAKQTLPETHPYLAITYGNIGDVHRLTGDTKAALSFLEKALSIQKGVTCNPIWLAWTYNYLAKTYLLMNEHPVALEYHGKAWQVLEKSLPATHPSLAQTQHHLANIYMEMRQYKLAHEHAERAVNIAQQKLSEKHPDLLEYKATLSELREQL